MNYGNLISIERVSEGYKIKTYESPITCGARYIVTIEHPYSVRPEMYYTDWIADGQAWAYRTIRDMRLQEAIA